MSGRTPPDLPTPSEVGLRVSIRLFEPTGGFQDILGHLESPTSVRKKDGSLADFDPYQIFVWKVVVAE